MDTSLSSRYRDVRPVHATADVRLDVAHDVVGDAAVWLLRMPGLDPADAPLTLALRAAALGGVGLTTLDDGPGSLVDAGDDVVLALPAVDTSPWLTTWSAAAPAQRQEMSRRLQSELEHLAVQGVPLGELDLAALVVTPHGMRLLPSAWLPPPVPSPGQATRTWSRDAARGAVCGLVSVLARRGGPVFDVASAAAEEPFFDKAIAAIERLDEGEALIVRARPADVDAIAAAIRGAARQRGAELLELRGGHALSITTKGERASALLVVADASNHADVAVVLEELSPTAWMDGHERLVWIEAGAPRDPFLDLFLRARFGHAPAEIDVSEAGMGVSEVVSSGPGRFLLDALVVADTALPLDLLRRLGAMSVEALAAEIVRARGDGAVRIATGHHVTGSGLQTTVAARGHAKVDDERVRELRALFPEVLQGTPTRRIESAWWRGRLLAHVEAVEDGTRQLRDVAKRAESKGLNLLAAGAYERLRALGGASNLDDALRAAALRSEILQRAGDVDGAQAALDEALARVTAGADAVDPRAWADLVFRAAQLDWRRSDFGSAETRLSDLLERTPSELPAEKRTEAYAELAWIQVHRGRTREAIRNFELALRRLDPLQNGALVARLHTQLGFAHYRQSDYAQSLVHYERALRLREELGDDLGVARTQNNMGLSFSALGQTREAETVLLDSIRRKRAGGDDLSMAASLLNLAVVRFSVGEYEGAEDVLDQAMEIALRRQHPETEAEVLGIRGDIALARGELDRAKELFESNLALCEANGHDAEALPTFRRLGATFLALGEDDAAAERLEEARRLLEVQPSRYEQARIDALEAEILARAGSEVSAVEVLSQAARGFARVGRPREQLETLVRRGQVEHELGQEAHVRATVAEIRDVLANHEIHRAPAGIDELERVVREQPVRDEPLGPEACLQALVRILEHPVDGMHDAVGAVHELGTALGADVMLWVEADGRASSARGRDWEVAALPPELDAAPDDPDTAIRRGRFDVYTAPDGRRRLVVARETPLRAHERELVRAAVLVWTEGRGIATENGAVAPATRAEPVIADARRFGLIGRSEGMRRVAQWIERVADTDLAVLVLGPNGSGKELVARALHQASGRASGPFVAINCASIPASLLESELFGHERGAFTSAHAQRIGRFEQAQGGTLFLDEIGEMQADMQAKLLRVLQERTFMRVGGSELLSTDARIVAATNRDLQAEVDRGAFRVDLYYRLNVVTIDVPSLRERLDDIEPLVRHFVGRDAPEYRGQAVEIDPAVFEHLRSHDWPGNVRELENAVRNALVFGRDDALRPEDFPWTRGVGPAAGEDPVQAAVDAIVNDERWTPDRPLLPRLELMIAHGLVERVGNKTLAAQLLGITKPTLYDRLRRYEALFGEFERDER